MPRLLLLLLPLFVSFFLTSADSSPGEPVDIPIDKDARWNVHYAVEELNRREHKIYYAAKINRAQKQELQGTNFIYNVYLTEGLCEKNENGCEEDSLKSIPHSEYEITRFEPLQGSLISYDFKKIRDIPPADLR